MIALAGAAVGYVFLEASHKTHSSETPLAGATPPASDGTIGISSDAATSGTTSASDQPDADFSDLFEQTRSGVVMIRATTCDGEGLGSGFLVGSEEIITAAHVVEGAASVAVVQDTGVHAATVTGLDVDADIAVLRLSGPLRTGHVFELAEDEVSPGTSVAVIGHPLGDPVTITEGNVSRVDDGLWPYIQLDVSVSPGNSGGPVLNSDGDVVGVLIARDAEREGLVYAVRSDFVGSAMRGVALPEAQRADCDAPLGPDYTEIPPVPADSDLAIAIADTFVNYFGGINSGDYELAFGELAPELGSDAGFDSFADGVSTSFDFGFQLGSVTSTADGAIVWLEFVSIQDPHQGPEGEACTEWSLDYELVWVAAGDLIIAGADGHSDDGHTPCP